MSSGGWQPSEADRYLEAMRRLAGTQEKSRRFDEVVRKSPLKVTAQLPVQQGDKK